MTVFIDYDNVFSSDRRLGLALLTEMVLETAEKAGYPPEPRTRVRLYGGWYEGPILSKRAQHLSAELASSFPFVYRHRSGSGACSVSAELALSL